MLEEELEGVAGAFQAVAGFFFGDEALVDGFVATGHPSTPGYNDPGHPYQGRIVGA